MKTIVYILFLLVIILNISACRRSPIECNISSEQVEKNIDLPNFDVLEINPSISLRIIQGGENKIKIKASKDVIDKIKFKIINNNRLVIKNEISCLVENPNATAYIDLTVNNIHKIIANTDKKIISNDTLFFDNLKIICENVIEGTNNIADFDLIVKTKKLDISANGTSIFNIRGKTEKLSVGFYARSPVFNGRELIADTIHFFLRASNDMHLYPVNKIEGDLYGYGDVYIYNSPQIIDIHEHFKGKIYFIN